MINKILKPGSACFTVNSKQRNWSHGLRVSCSFHDDVILRSVRILHSITPQSTTSLKSASLAHGTYQPSMSTTFTHNAIIRTNHMCT